MRKFILTVAMAVAALVGFSAAANAYSLAPGGSGTAVSDAALTFSGPLGITTSCDLELDTTLATSGNVGDVIGTVDAGRLANCVNRTSVLLPSWNIRLVSVTGSPISSALVNLEGVGFAVTLLGVTCLYSGTVGISIDQHNGDGYNTITVLSNRLASSSGGICGSGSLNAGQTFSLSPEQRIS